MAVAWVLSLAQELPHAVGEAKKKKEEKKEKKKKEANIWFFKKTKKWQVTVKSNKIEV